LEVFPLHQLRTIQQLGAGFGKEAGWNVCTTGIKVGTCKENAEQRYEEQTSQHNAAYGRNREGLQRVLQAVNGASRPSVCLLGGRISFADQGPQGFSSTNERITCRSDLSPATLGASRAGASASQFASRQIGSSTYSFNSFSTRLHSIAHPLTAHLIPSGLTTS
jgi:hypothetical protein